MGVGVGGANGYLFWKMSRVGAVERGYDRYAICHVETMSKDEWQNLFVIMILIVAHGNCQTAPVSRQIPIYSLNGISCLMRLQ